MNVGVEKFRFHPQTEAEPIFSIFYAMYKKLLVQGLDSVEGRRRERRVLSRCELRAIVHERGAKPADRRLKPSRSAVLKSSFAVSLLLDGAEEGVEAVRWGYAAFFAWQWVVLSFYRVLRYKDNAPASGQVCYDIQISVSNFKLSRVMSLRNFLILLVIVGGGLQYFYKHQGNTFMPYSDSTTEQMVSDSQRYHCAGKTRCSQMISCEEATFYLRNCPGVEIDGDGDGIPCESQWCGH